jgi:hypothetical protein
MQFVRRAGLFCSVCSTGSWITDQGLDVAWFDSMPPYVAAQNDAEFMEWLSGDWLEKM